MSYCSQGAPLPHPHLREGVGEDDERGGQVQGHPLAQVLHRGAEVVGHLVRVLLAAGGFVHLSTRRRAHGGGGRGEIERVGSTKNRLIAYLQWYLVSNRPSGPRDIILTTHPIRFQIWVRAPTSEIKEGEFSRCTLRKVERQTRT